MNRLTKPRNLKSLGLCTFVILFLIFHQSMASSGDKLKVTLTVQKKLNDSSLVVDIKAFDITSNEQQLSAENIKLESNLKLVSCWNGVLESLIALTGVRNNEKFNITSDMPYCTRPNSVLTYNCTVDVYSTMRISVDRASTGKHLTTQFTCSDEGAQPEVVGIDVQQSDSVCWSSEANQHSDNCVQFSHDDIIKSVDIICRENPTTVPNPSSMVPTSTLTSRSTIKNSVTVSDGDSTTIGASPSTFSSYIQTGELVRILAPVLTLIPVAAVTTIIAIIFIRRRRRAVQAKEPPSPRRERSMSVSNPAYTKPPSDADVGDSSDQQYSTVSPRADSDGKPRFNVATSPNYPAPSGNPQELYTQVNKTRVSRPAEFSTPLYDAVASYDSNDRNQPKISVIYKSVDIDAPLDAVYDTAASDSDSNGSARESPADAFVAIPMVEMTDNDIYSSSKNSADFYNL